MMVCFVLSSMEILSVGSSRVNFPMALEKLPAIWESFGLTEGGGGGVIGRG